MVAVTPMMAEAEVITNLLLVRSRSKSLVTLTSSKTMITHALLPKYDNNATVVTALREAVPLWVEEMNRLIKITIVAGVVND